MEAEAEAEDGRSEDDTNTQSNKDISHKAGIYTWRTDLVPSEPHWEGWYRGLSDTFLAFPGYKL
jgi:hypothetical protein